MKEEPIQVSFHFANGGKLTEFIITQEHDTAQVETIRLSPAQARTLAKSIMVKLRGAH